MTALFDGMAGVLNGVFGAPLVYTPVGLSPRVVQGVLRLGPIEVTDSEGHSVVIASPTLRIPRDVPDVGRRGDRVTSERYPDRVFSILNEIESVSPAHDGFSIMELEEVSG